MSLPRVALLISGGGSNMKTLVEHMQSRAYATPVLVVSNVPGAGGLQKAVDLGVPAKTVDHRAYPKDRTAFEAALIDALEPSKPDVICLAGFMRILSAEFVRRFPGRILNIHPSLLPKYKGLNTHARSLEAGDTLAGCTVHIVTPELDDGPILGQSRVPILAGDTPETLASRVLEQEHILYPECLERFLAENQPTS